MSELDDAAFSTVAYPIEQDKSPEQKIIESEQVQDDRILAALQDHPGWIKLREGIEQDIADFNSFKNIDMSKYNDKELGEVVRTERMVATKLQNYLSKIDEAVKAVISGRSETGG